MWNPVNTETKGICRSIRIIRGSALSGGPYYPGVRIIRMRVRIVHFTVVCFETWPLSGSEAGGDLVLIQTSCFSYVNAN